MSHYADYAAFDLLCRFRPFMPFLTIYADYADLLS